jgi:hypothetical protein
VTRLLVATLFAAASSLASGGHPADRVPPGYADACWGGRDNYPRYIAFSDRRVVVTVAAEQEDWDKLAGIFIEVATAHGLKVFDSSVAGPNLRALSIEACDASGISLKIDKRIFGNVQIFGQPPGKVEIALYTYRPDARFEPLEDTLVTKLQATWKKAMVERFPAVPPSKKALPDTVRRLLMQECGAATVPKPLYCEGL